MASAFAFAIWLLKTIENLCPLFVEANPNGQPRSIRLDLFRLAPWAASGAVICGHFQIFQIFQGITHYIWRETATECKRTQERLLSVFMPGISFVLRSLQSGMQPRMSQPTAKCKAYFSKKQRRHIHCGMHETEPACCTHSRNGISDLKLFILSFKRQQSIRFGCDR